MLMSTKRIVLQGLITQAIFATMMTATPARADYSKDDQYALDFDEYANATILVANRTDTRVQLAPAVVSLITAEDIRRMGARDLRDVLRTVPGFELGVRSFGYTEIGLRGVITDNTEKIRILLDGLPVNENLEGSGTIIFGDLALDNIERIEIIRGPGSALYGTNAFVGVISIITKSMNSEDDGASSIVSARAGSFATSEGSVLNHWRGDHWRVSTYVHYLDSDGFEQPIAQDSLQFRPDPPWYSDLNAGVSLAGTDAGVTDNFRRELTAQIKVSYDDYYFNGFYADRYKGPYLSTLFTVSEHSVAHPYQVQFSAGSKWQPMADWELSPNVYLLHYRVDNLWNTFPDGYRVPDGDGGTITYGKGVYSRNAATQETRGLELKSTWVLSYEQDFIAGILHETETLYDLADQENVPGYGPENMTDLPPIIIGNVDRQLDSIYAQYQWQPAQWPALTLGLRRDAYNDAGTSVTPRAALVWPINTAFTVKALYGEAFRAPTFVESYLFAAGGFVRGDINNKPETISSSELEGSYYGTGNLLIRLNVFRNRISDLLQLVPQPGGYIAYQNSPEVTIVEGGELELKLNERIDISGNYSVQSGRQQETGAALIGMAHSRANLALDYQIADSWHLHIAALSVAKRARATGDTRADLRGYNVVDLALGYQYNPNIEWRLLAHNLFDADQRYLDISGNSPQDFPWEGRAIDTTLRWSF